MGPLLRKGNGCAFQGARIALLLVLLPGLLLGAAALPGVGQFSPAWQGAMDHYLQTSPHDAITRLQERIDRGEVTLPYDPRRGYLPGVLRLLHIPVSSQALVFSRTSFRRNLISPKTPRALYFNDTTYVGSEQQADALEFISLDPQLGAVFYILPQKPEARPHFIRQTRDCLSCHLNAFTGHVPGLIVRSVYADDEGYPIPDSPSYLTTDASLFAERWGGWYVTGLTGRQHTMGNCFAGKEGDKVTLDTAAGANRTDLRGLMDTTPYLSPHSDIVALMVLAHQTRLQNLMIQAGYQIRQAMREAQASEKPATAAGPQIAPACEPLVRAMLFVEEVRLTDPVSGTSGFAEQFSALGPRDRQGRSLRQLDLKRRLLRYPCSFTIYSEMFNALPAPAKDYVFRRLYEILSGRDRSPEFASLSQADRRATLAILRATKPGHFLNHG